MTQIARVPSVVCFLDVSRLAGSVAEFVCKLSGLSGSRLTALVPSTTQHIFPWLPLVSGFRAFLSPVFLWFPVFEPFSCVARCHLVSGFPLFSSGFRFSSVFPWSAGLGRRGPLNCGTAWRLPHRGRARSLQSIVYQCSMQFSTALSSLP